MLTAQLHMRTSHIQTEFHMRSLIAILSPLLTKLLFTIVKTIATVYLNFNYKLFLSISKFVCCKTYVIVEVLPYKTFLNLMLMLEVTRLMT